MTRQQAKEMGFTHRAVLFGIPIFYNNFTEEVSGTNIFYDLMLDILIWLDLGSSNGFPIKITEEL